MKNEEISLNTKRALAEALKRAMARKPLQRITVSELIRDANVNRKTFYYHFQDIYALLKWMFEVEAIDVVKHFDLMVDSEEAIAFVMDYVEKNAHILSCANDSVGRDELRRFFCADFQDIIATVVETAQRRAGVRLAPSYRDFLTQLYAEALAGMLVDWVRDRQKRPREEVIRYLDDIIRQSLIGVLTAQSNVHFT